MKNFVRLLVLALGLVVGIGDAAYSQDYSQIHFNSVGDSVAYMRLQELRVKGIDEMTADELEEYKYYKNSDLDQKYKPRNMMKAGSSSFCRNAIAFCTDEGVYSYAAGTSDAQALDFSSGGTEISCLYTTPSPAWFYMRAATDGDLLIYMEHTGGYDIDFVCWGPFTAANSQQLLNNCVSSLQTSPDHGNHRPSNGNHSGDMGGYPDGNVIDCSYSVEATEWCYIPEVHAGEWYIFLITNYSTQPGTITFQSQWQSWMTSPSLPHTDCNIIADLSPSTPICEGSTLSIACSEVNGAQSYTWYYVGANRNETIGSGTQIATTRNLTRANATASMTGWYAVDIRMPSRTSRFLTYAIVTPTPSGTITASPSSSVCAGTQVTLTASATNATSYRWASGTGTTTTITPGASSTYIVTLTNTSTIHDPNTNRDVTNTCYSYANIRITVNPSPSVSIFPSEVHVCQGNSVTLFASAINCGDGEDEDCTYQWSTGATSPNALVTPTANESFYNVTATNSYGCTSESNQAVVSISVPGDLGTCNVIYVSTNGSGTGMSPNDPTDLVSALHFADCSGATIRMEIGEYVYDSPIDLVSNVTIEGGYFDTFTKKKSDAGATTIRRTNAQVTGPNCSTPQIIALRGDNISNFHMHDVTVKTDNAIALPNGCSQSTVYSCSGWTFTTANRTFSTITSGNSFSDATLIGSYGDGENKSISLPFDFTMCGTTYTAGTNLYVKSDGFLTFGQSSSVGNSTTTPQSLPEYTAIMPFEEDLYPPVNPEVYGNCIGRTITGSAGSRVLTIEWHRVPVWKSDCRTISYLTFQVKLYEGSNVIEFCYGSMPACSAITYYPNVGVQDIEAGNSLFVVANSSWASPSTSESYMSSTFSTSCYPSSGLVYRFTPDLHSESDGIINSSTNGVSTYAVYLENNCTNCSFTRCQLKPGNASNNSSGTNGGSSYGLYYYQTGLDSPTFVDCNVTPGSAGSGGTTSRVTRNNNGTITNNSTYTGTDFNLAGQTPIVAGSDSYPISACKGSLIQMTGATFTSFGEGATPNNGGASGTIVEYGTMGEKTITTSATRYAAFVNIIDEAPDVSNITISGMDTICCNGIYEDEYCLENLPNSTPVMINWSLTTSESDVASITSVTNSSCISLGVENSTGDIQYAYLRAELSTGCCGIIKVLYDTVVLMPVPPEVNQLSDHEICEGDDYTMSISVDENLLCHPIYQWVRDGEFITGVNSNTYTISNATASMAGDYSVYVGTDCGMESDVAHITVNPIPNLTVTSTPACANEATHFTITSDVNTTVTYNINTVNNGAVQTINLTAGVATDVNYTIEHYSVLTIMTMQTGSCLWNVGDVYSLDVYDDENAVFAGADFTICGREATLRGNSTVGSEWNGQWTIPNATDAANTTIADNTLYNSGVTYNGSEMPHSVTFRWTITSTHCPGRTFYDEVTGTFSSLTLTPTPTNVVCNGANNGSITITTTNGATPYSYTWSDDDNRTGNTANNLAPGTYTVTVNDANECSATTSVVITQPAALVAYIDTPDNTCPGSTVTLTGGLTTAGTANYTYTWSTTSDVSFTSNPVTVSATSVTSTATIPTACSGTYQINLHVQDGHGCTADATPINITASVGNSITISGGTNTKTVECVDGLADPHTLTPSVMPTVTDACGRDISSSATLTTSPNLSSITCEGSAAYVYTYTDCAGHTKTWTFTYTIQRSTAPSEVGGPVATTGTAECLVDATAPTTLPVVKDVCGNTLTAPTPVVTDNPNPITCGGTRTYTYKYKDCANKEFVWTYTYTIAHTTAPAEVGGPVATTGTAECLFDVAAPTTLPVVKDVCGNTLTAPTPVVTDNPDPITCGGTRKYTYTYKDCANKEFVWTYTYTIAHTTAPAEVGGPVATTGTAECLADASAPTTLPVVKDVCGNTLTAPTPVVTDNPDPITCAGTRKYTYTYKDCANKEFVWTYTYTISHTTAPSEVGGPVATTGIAECLADASAPTTLPVVKDVCGNTLTAPTPVVTDNPDPITCAGTRKYTYTYKDCANLEFVWTYTYTIAHTTAPSEVGGPVATTGTAECLADASAPTTLPVVKDVCGNTLTAPTPVVTDNPDPITCAGTRKYTYTYKDCANKEFVWTYTYTISHTTAPSEVGGPVATTGIAECLADASAPTTLPVVKDVCGNTLTAPTPVVTDNPDPITCAGTRKYTYTYKDCANLEFVWTYTYTIAHTTAPSEVGGPVATTGTAECLADASAPTTLPVVKDVCGNTLTAPTPVVTDNPDPLTCGGTREYTYTYKDCANLEFVWTYTFTIAHTTAPSEVGGPVATTGTAECLADVAAPTTLPVVKDVCGNTLTAPTPVVTDNPDPITCGGTRTYTYTYKDCANLEFVWTYTYTIAHTTAPLEFGGSVATTGTAGCLVDATAPTTLPVVKDVCGNTLTAPTPVVTDNPDPLTCGGTRTYTYTYKDCANLEFVWTYTFTIAHTTAPSEVGGPVATTGTAECLADVAAPTTLPVVKDVCGNTITAPTPVVTDNPDPITCAGTRTYTYTYKDCANLEFVWTYTYTIAHTTAPSEVGGPVATTGTAECLADVAAPTTLPVVKDVCGNTLTAPTPVVTDNPDPITCGGTRTYTYTYKDCANLEFVWTYTYTISHTTAPSEDGGPVATTGSAGCLVDATAPTTLPVVKDVCGNTLTAPTPVVTDNPDPMTCDGTRTYTYTYKDCANKEFVWTYTYTIERSDFDMPDNDGATVACASEITAPTLPEVTDACGNALTGVLKSGYPTETPTCNGDVRYVYTFTDCKGTAHDWTFTYTIERNIDPSFSGTWPNDISNQNVCYADRDISGLLADDDVADMYTAACGTISVSHSDVADPTSNCGWTVTRTYTITDGCNEVTNTMSVSGGDQTAPTIGDDDLDRELTSTDCVFIVPDLTDDVRAISSDNCTANADLTITQSPVAGTEVTAETTVTVTVTDLCSKSSTKQIVLTIPEELTASMNATTPACSGGTTSASVIVNGGTSPYEYHWSDDGSRTGNIATDIDAGYYQVSVSDANGCTTEANIDISNPDELIATISADAIYCHNATTNITVNVQNGTPDYTYIWSDDDTRNSNIASGVSAGSYEVAVSDANGCTAIASIDISNPDELTASMSADAIYCHDATTNITVDVQNGTPDYTYIWSDDDTRNGNIASNVSSGSYTVYVTDAHDCTAVASIEISNPEEFTASMSADAIYCHDATTNITVNVQNGTPDYTYIWSDDDTRNGNTASDVSAGSYTVSVSDAHDCIAIASIDISNPEEFTASMSADAINCYGETTNITVNVENGTADYTYVWSDDDTRNGNTASDVSEGTYTVTVRDAHSCSAEASITITQPDEIIITVESTSPQICETLGSITVSAEGGTGELSYAWSTTAHEATYSELTAGNYTVTVTDENRCSATRIIEVEDHSVIPDVDITNNTGVTVITCAVTEISLTAEGTGDFEWSNGEAGAELTVTTPDIYTVTITDANGCVNTATIPIEQSNENPVVTLVDDNITICAGQTATVAIDEVTNGVAPYHYSWNGGTYGDYTEFTTSPLSADDAVTVDVKDDNGCIGSATASITVNNRPTAEISGGEAICNGEGATFTITFTGAPTYNYTWSDGTNTHDESTNESSVTINVTPTSTTTYTLVSLNDANCASIDSDLTGSVEIIVNKMPTAAIATTDNIMCVAPFSGVIAVDGFGPETGDYTVSLEGTGFSAQTVAYDEVASFTELAAGNYDVQFSYTANSHTCSTVVPVTISDELSYPSVDVTAFNNGCAGENNGTIEILASNGTPDYTYAWTDADDNVVTCDADGNLSGLGTGTYTVTVTDAHGCATSTSQSISSPDVALSATISGPTEVCNNTTATLTVNAEHGTPDYSYEWSDAAHTITASITTPTLDDNNTPFTYTVVVTDANGCTIEASHTVTIGDTPQLALSADAEICYGSNATLTATVTNAGANYAIVWTSNDSGAGLPANVDTEEIVVTPTSTSTYTATLTTDVCNTGSDYVVIDNISVTVNPKPEVDITTANANVCPDAIIDLDAELTVEGTADYTYTWSASAGLTLAETGDITTDATTTTNSVAAPEASATSCGATYSINLHVVDANGCTADAIPMEITVVDDVAPVIGTADLDRTLASTDCTFIVPDLTGEVRAISTDNCTDVAALTITQNPLAGEEIAAQSTVTVTVTDQCGTSNSVDIVLSVPDALSLNEVAASHINATGNGRTDGVLEVFANGGTPEYQYRINDGEYQSSGIFPGLGAGIYTVEVVDANGCTTTISIEITEPNVLEATISTPVALLCNGDDTDVTVNVTGGTEPYHFAWSDGNEYDVNVVSGLTAGTYTVTVSDVNNCIAIATVEITQPEQLQASLSADEINCNGETATAIVTVSGGTQDYSYAWSDDNTRTGNTASGLTAGTYTVTVTDANLCRAEAEIVITQPTAITISVESTSPQICETLGSIEVSATGGTGTLSYAWSTTAHDAIYSDLMAGNYTVTVTDENNCSATETIEVEDHSVIPDVSIVNNTGTELLTCDVLEIYLIADGTGEFAWSNGEIGAELIVTTPDNYTVTITDANGCINSASVRIDQSNGTPIVVLANDDITICAGTSTTVEVASVTGGVTPYEYSWDDGATFGTEPQYATGNLLADGSYSVIVRDANGCTGDAIATVTVNAPSVGTLGLAGETTICDGSSTALTVVSDNDNVGDLTFAWSNGLGNDATSADITAAGDYSVTVTATNVVNTLTCTDETVLTENVSVNVRPTAIVSGSTAICADNTDGQMVTFTFTGTAPFVYTWSDGTSSHNETTNNATVTITVTPSETTTYSITALSDANCTATDGDMANSATITVNELPVVVLATPAAICDGQSTTIEIESLTGGTPSYQYSWDGGVTFGSSNEYNTGVLSTDATFNLIVRDANGCTASAETTVSVGENILPVFADYEACNGDTQIVLPTESENGITGTWSPAIVDMTSSHTYTFTPDPSFCAQQTSIDVTIHDRPTVSVSGSVAICEGNTDGQVITMSFTGVAPYEYTWSDGNGTYSETTNDNVVTMYVTPTATTTYSIVSLQDNNGCSANDLSSSATVTVNANPTVSIIVPYEEINCRHRTITATATGSEATYDWSNGSSSSTAVFTSAGEYSVIASAPNGCTAEASVEITENLTPPDVAIDNTTGSEWLNCIYTSISVTATGGESYRWSSGQTTAGITITAPNTYIVTATGTNGCEATASIEIHQPEDLAITVSYSEIACHGGTTTVSVTAEGGTPSYGGTGIFPDVSSGTHTYTVTDEGGCSASETIYLADPSDITVIVTYDPVLCNGDATTVTVSAEGGTPYAGSQQYDGTGIRTEHAGHHTYTVSDRNGCEATASITITEPDRLESFATTQDAQCFGMLGTAIIDVTGGTTPYGITWQDGTTGPQNSSVSVGSPFSYMVVDGNGCHISGSVTVSQPDLLEVSLTGENVSCAGMADGRIESTVTGGNEPYTYAWSNGGILQNAEWLAPGTYRLTVTDSHSCTSYSSTIITEPQPLTASLYPTDVQCGYMLGTLTATVSGGTPDYAYSWSDSHIAGTGSTEVYSGDYTLTVTDGHGCTATASAGVHVNGGIDARVTVVSGITCPGDSDAVLEATSQQGAEPFTYSWSSGSVSQTLIGAGAGTYTVVITDAWGCTGSGQATVESPTAMDVTLTTTDAHCHNTSDGTITVDVTGGTFPYSYAWSEPTFAGSSVSHASAGSYLLTVTDTRGCEVHLVATVGSPEAIVITSNVANISCHGRRDGIVEVSAEGGTEPYYFSLFNGHNTVSGQSTYTHLGEGGYEITAIDANGCQETRNIYVVEPAELTAEVDGVDPSCKGNNDGQILITAVGGTEPYMYGWSDRYSDQPVISALYAGEYTVSVVDANSCAYSANVTINPSYADCLKIPNVFTPNGDGINDTWEIGNIDMFPKAHIYVFNRWGQLLYEAEGTEGSWDGKIRGGSMAPAGVYMYIINLNTGNEAYEGTLTIIY